MYLTFGTVPIDDWDGPDSTRWELDGSPSCCYGKRADRQVKRSRTSSNCSTSDRCRRLAVYGLSLSSAAAAQVTHLWLEFAGGI